MGDDSAGIATATSGPTVIRTQPEYLRTTVAISKMTKTYNRWNVAVTTTKKSQARTAPAWLWNAVHDCVDRPRGGR